MSSNLLVIQDERFQEYLLPADHPDSPGRLEAIALALDSSGLGTSIRRTRSRPATNEELARVHSPGYLQDLEDAGRVATQVGKAIRLNADMWIGPTMCEGSKLAAGAGCLAVESVFGAKERNCFVVARPPGHHAMRDKAMGLCLLNNIAVAARHAQEKLGLQRILIIDWDVHHGNGTQASFYYDPSVCFISLHRQWPFYPPDSGLSSEDGEGEGKGFNINIPLPAGTGDRGYLKCWDALVAPIAHEFAPELILLSAGYDAHCQDPLGGQCVSTVGYFLLSQRLAELGEKCHAPVVAFLEGGYNEQALAESVVSTMRMLNCCGPHERDELVPPGAEPGGDVKPQTGDSEPDLVDNRIAKLSRHFGQYWSQLKEL